VKTSNSNLSAALRILANDIKSPDDVPALCLREAADRIDQMNAALKVAAGWLPWHEMTHPEYEGEKSDAGRLVRAAIFPEMQGETT